MIVTEYPSSVHTYKMSKTPHLLLGSEDAQACHAALHHTAIGCRYAGLSLAVVIAQLVDFCHDFKLSSPSLHQKGQAWIVRSQWAACIFQHAVGPPSKHVHELACQQQDVAYATSLYILSQTYNCAMSAWAKPHLSWHASVSN